jgi:hypothetical protein
MLRLGQNDEGGRLMTEAIASAGAVDAGASEFYAAGLAEDLSGNQARARNDFLRALQAAPSSWQARVELERLAAPR